MEVLRLQPPLVLGQGLQVHLELELLLVLVRFRLPLDLARVDREFDRPPLGRLVVAKLRRDVLVVGVLLADVVVRVPQRARLVGAHVPGLAALGAPLLHAAEDEGRRRLAGAQTLGQ